MRRILASNAQVGQRVENGGVVSAVITEADGYTQLRYGGYDRGRFAPGVTIFIVH